MKILIPGGDGYKGIKLTKALLEEKHDVTVLDNFMYGFEPFLHLLEYPNLKVEKADIRNEIKNLHLYEVVCHQAGISGFPAKIVKYRFSEEEINFLQHFKWWEKDMNWLK